MGKLEDAGMDEGVRTFEKAKSTLYGTIRKTKAGLEDTSSQTHVQWSNCVISRLRSFDWMTEDDVEKHRPLASWYGRRTSTVDIMKAFVKQIQLDLSGLSVIHVTGTKGKGSTCAMVESILRQCGFKTGLFTSPHLLEVTERIRLNGKPIAKEAFAIYFFQVWDRLQATLATPVPADDVVINNVNAAVELMNMPGYFQLLTLVGLWCFVEEKVDVCIVEVGVGGRYDATNVVPAPTICGVAMLDLDHIQVLGNTLVKIAWEKGGIFKEGCAAFTVDQSEGAIEVLRQCAAEADCKLEVVPPLSNVDSTGMAYGIGLSGDHQRINAGLALRLCLAWMEQESPRPLALGNGGKTAGGDVGARPPGSAFAGGEHSGNKGENDGAHGTGPKTPDAPNNSAVFRGREAFLMSLEVHRGLAGCSWPGRCQVFRPPSHPAVTVYLDGAHTEQSMHACLQWFIAKAAAAERASSCESNHSVKRQRSQRVLCFNASHERDILPLLNPLVRARARDINTLVTTEVRQTDARIQENNNEDCDEGKPLFDAVWFVKVPSARPSRFTPATAQEILARHGLSTTSGLGETKVLDCDDKVTSDDQSIRMGSNGNSRGGSPIKTGTQAWPETLEQVWLALQRREGGPLSITGTGNAPDLLGNLVGQRSCAAMRSCSMASSIGCSDVVDFVEDMSEFRLDVDEESGEESDVRVALLCTGSLYVVSAVLEAFGAEIV